jgi:hypothetical protein
VAEVSLLKCDIAVFRLLFSFGGLKKWDRPEVSGPIFDPDGPEPDEAVNLNLPKWFYKRDPAPQG